MNGISIWDRRAGGDDEIRITKHFRMAGGANKAASVSVRPGDSIGDCIDRLKQAMKDYGYDFYID